MSYFPGSGQRRPSVSKGRLTTLLLAALAVTAAAPARAADAPDDKTAQARALSQEANASYAVGEFEQAGEKYQSAYKLKPDPALLYNAAQSYRMAGNNEKALLLYKNYTMFYPTAKNIHNAEVQVAKLQEAIAAQHKAQTQPPTTTEPTSGTGAGVAPGGTTTTTTTTTTTPVTGTSAGSTTASSATGAATTSSPAPTVPAAPPPPTSSAPPGAMLTESATPPSEEGTPVYKKWWLWTAIGVAAAGTVTVVLLSSRSSAAWNTAPDFGPGAKETSR